MKKFKKGDQVIVTGGRDKGKTGEITKILVSEDRVLIKGVNLYKKHQKKTQDRAGSIISLERPLPTANVMLVVDGKPVRVGLKKEKDGVVRINKKTGKKL